MADSVLTSGCSFISQQIWIQIFIALAILGTCIMIEKLSPGNQSVDRHISRWHTFNFGYVSCLVLTGWYRWRSGQMWPRFWCRLFASLWWRCTRAFAPPRCLGILCCAVLAREAAVRLIFSNRSQVYFHRSLHIIMPRKLNSPLLLVSDFGTRFRY